MNTRTGPIFYVCTDAPHPTLAASWHILSFRATTLTCTSSASSLLYHTSQSLR